MALDGIDNKYNPGLLAFNRGLVSPKALGRVDLDRTMLSAEVMTNWLPKTQGAMTIRPGTKYFGSSLNDTGAVWVEFVAATDDLAMIELTTNKMRVWLGDDAHSLALLGRPLIATTVSLSDTGWSEDNRGGGTRQAAGAGAIPAMTAATTNGVTMSGSSDSTRAWKAADRNPNSSWNPNAVPQQLIVDFGSGNTKAVQSFRIQAGSSRSPRDFDLQGASSSGGPWTTEASFTNQSFSSFQTREFDDTGYTDTGANAWRFWRLNVTDSNDGAGDLRINEFQLVQGAADVSDTGQVVFDAGTLSLNAGAKGSLARVRKAVVVDTGDLNVEHSLAINVTRGPVTLRVGSSSGDDDLIRDARLETGYHNLAFLPVSSPFHITIQSEELVERIVGSLTIGDTGTVELIAPWGQEDLDNIRWDQSADVIFADAVDVRPQRIERRGTGDSVGRSWSVVDYVPDGGPFKGKTADAVKLSLSQVYGNTTLSSDVPFFKSGHAGALFQLTRTGQSGTEKLGYIDAVTRPFEITGICDTGTPGNDNERRALFTVTGTYVGTITIERSYNGPDYGFHPANPDFLSGAAATDTGTFTRTLDDENNNISVWYRARLSAWTSGTAFVNWVYRNGYTTAVVRTTAYNDNQNMSCEIVDPPCDTGTTDDWQEGSWSEQAGYPSAVALHEGRLAHAGKANLWMSVSDDYHNFDENTVGDAGPLNRTFGSGPVDSVYYLVSALRLLAGTPGAETVIKGSSLDEVLTPSNAAARPVSSQGSMNMRAIRRDTDVFFVQRSQSRVFRIAVSGGAFDYETGELTALVPDLLAAGVTSMAIQRQPDTRFHFALGDGTVVLLTYCPEEQINVMCWSKWETNGFVERVMVLPGETEDAVYYHVRRDVSGPTKRFLEKWALESECEGDTGLTWLSDCAAQLANTDSGVQKSGLLHLRNSAVVIVAQDTGQATAMRDLSPDVAGVQRTYTVGDSGLVILDTGNFTNIIGGLSYVADYKTTKLAFAAAQGTALAQLKRTDKIGFVLYRTHNNALFFGSDTGKLDALPRKIDNGAAVDADKIFDHLDQVAMPFPGLWSADSRVVMRAKAPRPVTVLAAVPTVTTNERI